MFSKCSFSSLNLKFSHRNISFFVFLKFLFLILFLSVVVGSRNVNIGADTLTYINYFNGLKAGQEYRYEPIFSFFSKSVAYFQFSYQFFFAILYLCFNIVYALSFSAFLKSIKRKHGVYLNWYVFFGLIFLSSWYFTANTNGIRHGLALPFVYLSLVFMLNGKKIKSVLLFITSIGFHYSSLLLLPFLPLMFLKPKLYWFIFIFLALGYPFGINEILVKLLSNVSGLGIYEFFSNYADGSTSSWYGFSLALYLYTLGWLLILFFSTAFVCDKNKVFYRKTVRVYSLLMLPYLVFGFGAFSNRYAFTCWLFLPIVQSVLLASSNLSFKVKFVIGGLLFISGFHLFLFRFYFL